MSLPHLEADAAGFVLAGGQSSRMGVDKALIDFAGRPLIARALGILRAARLDASIAGARSDLEAYAPVVADAAPGLGPLGGICAALASTPAQWSVFIAVDSPLMPPSILVFLLAHARVTGATVTLASVNGFAQTFPAVIHCDALHALKVELKAGRGGCYSAYQAAGSQGAKSLSVLPVEVLVQSGQVFHPDGLPATRWFLNLNSQRDLERAASHRVS